VRIEAVSADTVLVEASAKEMLSGASGASMPWLGLFTGVAIRTPEGWKLRSGHWSKQAATDP
jgi:hypothetical protein